MKDDHVCGPDQGCDMECMNKYYREIRQHYIDRARDLWDSFYSDDCEPYPSENFFSAFTDLARNMENLFKDEVTEYFKQLVEYQNEQEPYPCHEFFEACKRLLKLSETHPRPQ